MTDAEWTPWAGGECPLPKGAKHEVKFRNGFTDVDDEPETWNWEHHPKGDQNHVGDIIAYRLARP